MFVVPTVYKFLAVFFIKFFPALVVLVKGSAILALVLNGTNAI